VTKASAERSDPGLLLLGARAKQFSNCARRSFCLRGPSLISRTPPHFPLGIDRIALLNLAIEIADRHTQLIEGHELTPDDPL